jgi:putative acyl-CoA dehydrogenase
VTHEVTNQPPPLQGYDAYATDAALQEAVQAFGAGWADERLHEIGAAAGEPAWQDRGRLANENSPRLRTHDRYGHRLDEVEFHPSWHDLMTFATGHGLHAAPWRDPRPGAHLARAAGFYLWSQVEAGHGCPMSMTYAAVPALRRQPELAQAWEPRLTALGYDPDLHPGKTTALCGMAMTEKQGGSDVRANTTGATRAGDHYLLTGHKWFCSAPMSDAFLVLAQAPGGLTCFLLPRVLPDGTRNAGFRIQRLKDKLGNRSNASSEIELVEAVAWRVGDEGRGVPTIVEMVNLTRLDCVIGSAAGMRLGVAQATHHAAHRSAFGRRLAEQPLMRNVLADLAVESEAATLLMARVAAALDDEEQAPFRRIATAVAKYWVCKRAPAHAAEALECLGGNGYVEDSGMPRLFRESPLNGIWEGSGNVNALDVLRALAKEPATASALREELATTAGADRRLDAAVASVERELADPDDAELRARRVVERLALVLQASLLVRHGDPAVTAAFLATRVGGDGGRAFGTLPRGTDVTAIVERTTPKVS